MHPLKPHQYQIKALQFAIQKMHTYMMVDCGLGKTLIALMFAIALKRPLIVVAPMRVAKIVWPDEINKWYPGMSYVVLHGPKKDQLLKLQRNVYLINYEGLPWFFRQCVDGKFPLRKYPFIFDESSCFKEANTNRFKILKKMQPMMSKYRMNLSGTPAPIGLHNLWSQYYILDGGKRLGKSYSGFRDLHFNYSGPPYYRTTLKSKAEAQIIYSKIKDITFRLEATDYLQMPNLMNITHSIKLPARLLTVYQELEAKAAYEFESGESVTAFNDIILRSKLRQFMQGAMYVDGGNNQYKVMHTLKIDFLKEFVEELQGEPLLIAIQYRFEIDMIRKALGNVPCIAGGTTAGETETILRRWNLRQVPVLLCHPKSLKFGMNMQAAGRRVLWYGLPFSIEDYIQLYSRFWRQGQVSDTVFNHHLVITNTVDDAILPVLYDRNATQEQLFAAVKRRLHV